MEKLFFLMVVFVDVLFGYIDPGTGSAIAAMIMSAIVGFGVYVKLYWHKLRAKFAK